MPVINTNGVKIHYEIRGKGPPLILIMGLATGSQAWVAQGLALQERFRCIFIDNRGSGKSTKPRGSYSTHTMASDVFGLVNSLGISKTHLIGFSLGGCVAQEFALNYPERVDRLILSNSFSKIEGKELERLNIWKQMIASGRKEGFLDNFIFQFFSKEYIEQNAKQLAVFRLSISAGLPPLHALIGQIGALEKHDTRRRLCEIRCQTLVITGTHDTISPVSYGKKIACLIPQASHCVISGGTHAAFFEKPDEYNEIVMNFLSD